MKYLRLFRFGEQYPLLGSALAAGIYLGVTESWILFWALASAIVSAAGFAVNELVDGKDVDQKSWNPIHVAAHQHLDSYIVWPVITFVLLTGLTLSYVLGVFWWGLLVFVLWTLYSVPPVRLKGLPVADLLTQLVTGIWVPFLAVLYHYHWTWNNSILFLLVPLSVFIIVPVLEYQLADYEEDKRFGLRSTHVVLGIDQSLILGMAMELFGLLFYIAAGTYRVASWSVIFIPVALYTLYDLYSAHQLKTVGLKLKRFEYYVRHVKPATWLMIPVLFWWWYFVQ